MIGRVDRARHEVMLEVALRIAKAAARIAIPRVRQLPMARKPDDSMVTQTDHDVQEFVLAEISQQFPDHARLAEESVIGRDSVPVSQSRYCWVVDPIDGTRNFITGFPCFATSIAVLDRGTPVAAAICEHNQGALFGAAKGLGATLDGQRISVRQPPTREDWLIWGPSTNEPVTMRILERIIRAPGLIYRNVGSSAVHLCWVASGAMAAAFAQRCKIWDLAAGALIVSEAGGTITGLDGRLLTSFDLSRNPDEDIPFLAGAPQAHVKLLDLVAK
jgi:myo-inositol-1(or 4)-monophosphatase